MKKRQSLQQTSILIFIVILITACISKLGGNFTETPASWKEKMSKNARKLIQQAYKGLEGQTIYDYHTHIMGLGNGCRQCFINPAMQSLTNPSLYIRYKIYLSSLAITDLQQSDKQMIQRLVTLQRTSPIPIQHYILAFDKYYHHTGKVDLTKTEFYTPNSYAFQLAEKYQDAFLPAISIHPYRKDALQQLEYWAQKGVRLIKWLPNAQGIDPSDKRIEAYYRKIIERNMILLTHSGEEKAVESEEDQKLGNPLLLRYPLSLGVKMIVAHCASLGVNTDFENQPPREVDNFSLFMRLFEDPRYQNNLYADISAITLITRIPKPVLTLLEKPQLHTRLVNGSDYPIPAINALVHTGKFVDLKMITSQEQDAINEIYRFNPILFDFVLKRTLKHPKTGQKFADSIFTRNLFASDQPPQKE